jgi:two-component system sensor histidine kinase/response regulator
MTLQVQDFEIARIIEQVCRVFSDKAAAKNLNLAIDLDNVPAVMWGDGERLGRILHHLVGNAVKFTEKGGITIVVRTVNENQDSIIVQCQVRDTGIGMTHEQLNRIFLAFEQADGSLTRRYGGTGLGLSLCKRLVEGVDGRIEAESQVGQGSVFLLEIPFQKSLKSSERIKYFGPFQRTRMPAADNPAESGEMLLRSRKMICT